MNELANIAVIIILFLFGVCIGLGIMDNNWKREAVKLGHAHYNPTNASFEWNVITNK